jgi:hypothetical protein
MRQAGTLDEAGRVLGLETASRNSSQTGCSAISEQARSWCWGEKVGVEGRSDGMPRAHREPNGKCADRQSAKEKRRGVCTGMTTADVKVKQVRASSLHIQFVYVGTAALEPVAGEIGPMGARTREMTSGGFRS